MILLKAAARGFGPGIGRRRARKQTEVAGDTGSREGRQGICNIPASPDIASFGDAVTDDDWKRIETMGVDPPLYRDLLVSTLSVQCSAKAGVSRQNHKKKRNATKNCNVTAVSAVVSV